jgi:hypothetical protein
MWWTCCVRWRRGRNPQRSTRTEATFPARPEGADLSLRFRGEANPAEWALRLRQQDVKQTWKILLNGEELGRLAGDENDQVIYSSPIKTISATVCRCAAKDADAPWQFSSAQR